MTRSVIDDQADPGQVQRHPVGQLEHVVRLGEGEAAEELLAGLSDSPLAGSLSSARSAG